MPRTLKQILADRLGTVLSDAEEQLVDQHIEACCREIQATWTPEERELRRLGRCGDRDGLTTGDMPRLLAWTPPEHSDRELFG